MLIVAVAGIVVASCSKDNSDNVEKFYGEKPVKQLTDRSTYTSVLTQFVYSYDNQGRVKSVIEKRDGEEVLEYKVTWGSKPEMTCYDLVANIVGNHWEAALFKGRVVSMIENYNSTVAYTCHFEYNSQGKLTAFGGKADDITVKTVLVWEDGDLVRMEDALKPEDVLYMEYGNKINKIGAFPMILATDIGITAVFYGGKGALTLKHLPEKVSYLNEQRTKWLSILMEWELDKDGFPARVTLSQGDQYETIEFEY